MQEFLNQFALSFVSTETLKSRISRGARIENKLHRRSSCGGWQGTMLASTPSSSRSMTDWRSPSRPHRRAHPRTLHPQQRCTLIDGTGSASYHSPPPQAMKMYGVACTCLDSANGDIAKVKKAWLSLWCPAQYLMIDKDAKNEPGGLVLGATPHGVIIWKKESHTCGHFQYWLSHARLGKGLTDSSWYLKPCGTT